MIKKHKLIRKLSYLNMKRILFVCDTPPHPVHEEFAKSIGADFFCYPNKNTKELIGGLRKIPKNYDIYFTEGLFNYVLLSRSLGFLKKSSKIINLFSDPRLFQIFSGKKFDFKNLKTKKYPFIEKKIIKKNIEKLDGAICIGKFSASLFRRYNYKSPMKKVYVFIFNKKFKSLSRIKPKLSNHNILFIGYGPDFHYKGLDILIEVFKNIKKKFPDAKLYILGKWDVKREWKSKDVYFEGFKKINPYLKDSSLSLHIGRGESFGINILESMLAGLPTIVSKYTGAKEAVEKVDKKFVVPLDKKVISKRITDYFNLNLKRKKELSKKCRKVSREFNEKEMLKLFKEKFRSLLKDIYKKEINLNIQKS